MTASPEMESPYCVYRPELDALPGIALPVFPRSSGYVCRKENDPEDVPPGVKNFVQIFWGVSGEGEFEVRGEKCLMRPGDVFYRLPMQPHRLRSRSAQWKYRWVAFDGPGAENFMQSYGYPEIPFHAGPCPHEYFINFKALILQRTPYCWRMMFAEICRILAAAGGTNSEPTFENRIVLEVISICKDRYDDPDLNVNSLAAELSIGRSTLLGIFKKKMNLTLSAYLSQVRLQAALSMLKNTLLPLHGIASECGFRDVNYFCRFIKNNTGRKPSELR